MKIRAETDSDVEQVREVNRAAFAGDAEATLVDRLRAQADPSISLVAVEDARVVGHIMFSPVTFEPGIDRLIMGLAPMAVRPDRQRQGIGSALVRAGLELCRTLGAVAVVVLGHPAYYPRFGFSAASRRGVRSVYEAPDEAFMLLELECGALPPGGGTVRFAEAFDAP